MSGYDIDPKYEFDAPIYFSEKLWDDATQPSDTFFGPLIYPSLFEYWISSVHADVTDDGKAVAVPEDVFATPRAEQQPSDVDATPMPQQQPAFVDAPAETTEAPVETEAAIAINQPETVIISEPAIVEEPAETFEATSSQTVTESTAFVEPVVAPTMEEVAVNVSAEVSKEPVAVAEVKPHPARNLRTSWGKKGSVAKVYNTQQVCKGERDDCMTVLKRQTGNCS